ncbi:hypothetical protein [Paenibacillus beijingensis]|uniref:Uncharacterized protein n=1 Tax=Paenibacillus beijingensis TaxID=1126833 RepID=A0A0D5NPU9_9BACL|nr:hypothetical protein [Paenibacillus beijingensis]AJY77334.1 hypothetical protein VN24_25700 [Paenibacillus beijingensis]
MNNIVKISAGILSLSLLAVQFAQPIQAAPAGPTKHGQLTAETAKKSSWDKSSLSFTGQTSYSGGISATVQNKGSQMDGETVYELYRVEKGNPKNGEIVALGIIKPLGPGETQQLTYVPNLLKPGKYIFKAYQRPGHPGTGELWSSSITVKEQEVAKDQLEPERPLDQFFNSTVEEGTATFTVPEGMKPVEISFSSYVYPEGVVPQQDGAPYENQTVYDNVTATYGPGTHTVHVQLPPNQYWQTDLYLGPVIETLTESGHPMDKIIDADYSPAATVQTVQ